MVGNHQDKESSFVRSSNLSMSADLPYSKTSFLVQIKFITGHSEQTQTQTLIIN